MANRRAFITALARVGAAVPHAQQRVVASAAAGTAASHHRCLSLPQWLALPVDVRSYGVLPAGAWHEHEHSTRSTDSTRSMRCDGGAPLGALGGLATGLRMKPSECVSAAVPSAQGLFSSTRWFSRLAELYPGSRHYRPLTGTQTVSGSASHRGARIPEPCQALTGARAFGMCAKERGALHRAAWFNGAKGASTTALNPTVSPHPSLGTSMLPPLRSSAMSHRIPGVHARIRTPSLCSAQPIKGANLRAEASCDFSSALDAPLGRVYFRLNPTVSD